MARVPKGCKASRPYMPKEYLRYKDNNMQKCIKGVFRLISLGKSVVFASNPFFAYFLPPLTFDIKSDD